jgi:hypothetical protein
MSFFGRAALRDGEGTGRCTIHQQRFPSKETRNRHGFAFGLYLT